VLHLLNEYTHQDRDICLLESTILQILSQSTLKLERLGIRSQTGSSVSGLRMVGLPSLSKVGAPVRLGHSTFMLPRFGHRPADLPVSVSKWTVPTCLHQSQGLSEPFSRPTWCNARYSTQADNLRLLGVPR